MENNEKRLFKNRTKMRIQSERWRWKIFSYFNRWDRTWYIVWRLLWKRRPLRCLGAYPSRLRHWSGLLNGVRNYSKKLNSFTSFSNSRAICEGLIRESSTTTLWLFLQSSSVAVFRLEVTGTWALLLFCAKTDIGL